MELTLTGEISGLTRLLKGKGLKEEATVRVALVAEIGRAALMGEIGRAALMGEIGRVASEEVVRETTVTLAILR